MMVEKMSHLILQDEIDKARKERGGGASFNKRENMRIKAQQDKMREQEEMAKAALRSRMPAMRGTRGGWGTRGTPPIDIYQEINN